MLKRFFTIFTLAFLLYGSSVAHSFSLANNVHAADSSTVNSTDPEISQPEVYLYTSKLLPGPKEANFRKYFVDTLIPRGTRLLISLTAAAAVLTIIYGGYRLLFFGGAPENLEAGKNTIVWSVVGLLIAIFAFFIVSLVSRISF